MSNSYLRGGNGWGRRRSPPLQLHTLPQFADLVAGAALQTAATLAAVDLPQARLAPATPAPLLALLLLLPEGGPRGRACRLGAPRGRLPVAGFRLGVEGEGGAGAFRAAGEGGAAVQGGGGDLWSRVRRRVAGALGEAGFTFCRVLRSERRGGGSRLPPSAQVVRRPPTGLAVFGQCVCWCANFCFQLPAELGLEGAAADDDRRAPGG